MDNGNRVERSGWGLRCDPSHPVEKYDPEFHIHLEDMPEVEADRDVTIRAPAYLDILKSEEFKEFKSDPFELPAPVSRRRPSKGRSQKPREQKPRKKQ